MDKNHAPASWCCKARTCILVIALLAFCSCARHTGATPVRSEPAVSEDVASEQEQPTTDAVSVGEPREPSVEEAVAEGPETTSETHVAPAEEPALVAGNVESASTASRTASTSQGNDPPSKTPPLARGGGEETVGTTGANSQLPQTVKQAVGYLLTRMTDKDKLALKQTRKSRLLLLHHTLGRYVRNELGLLGDNARLRDDCVKQGALPHGSPELVHPDDASMVIVSALWDAVQSEPLTEETSAWRLWQMAENLRANGESESAEKTLRSIIQRYPHTCHATMIREELGIPEQAGPAIREESKFMRTETFEGYIFSAHDAADSGVRSLAPASFLEPIRGFWTPREADVREAEAGLVAGLRAEIGRWDDQDNKSSRRAEALVARLIKRLPTQGRQYFGVLYGGKRVLVISFFPGSSFSKVHWSSRAIRVMDGGASFWRIRYDMESKRYSNLETNGSA